MERCPVLVWSLMARRIDPRLSEQPPVDFMLAGKKVQVDRLDNGEFWAFAPVSGRGLSCDRARCAIHRFVRWRCTGHEPLAQPNTGALRREGRTVVDPVDAGHPARVCLC